MKPFSYKNKIVGVEAFETEIQKSIGHARDTVLASRQRYERDPKACKNVWQNHADTPNPLESRFGSDWQNKFPKLVELVCITEFMDHVVTEGDQLFKGT